MQEEEKHLKYTLKKYDEVIADSRLKMKNLKNYYSDYDEMMDEKERLEHKIIKIEESKETPYFARIDFQGNQKEICYIGKYGVSDYENNIVTIDWRAPISTLYYDSNIGACEYNSPIGTIKGELLLKRQYQIEKQKLIDYQDVDTVSNDEILKPYLSVSADTRLKNIVSTIQSEQNKIIRYPLKNLIIQGVAGSGKTTVALHRIAYLVYNNKEIIKPKDYMVIGPNKFFVKYISKILPDLDVNGVDECTLEEILEKYTKEKYKINNHLDKIIEYDKSSELKTSLKMKNIIDNYMDKVKIYPEKIEIEGIEIISNNEIKRIIKEINEKIYKSIKQKQDRIYLLLDKYIKENKQKIVNKLIEENINNKTLQELKKSHTKFIKNNIPKIKTTKEYHKQILIENNMYKDELEIEDVPSLLYIKYKLGNDIFDNYKHIVIDEAQDYGEFMFYVIKKIFKNATFGIFGDLAQSLYSYRSIKDWNIVKKIFNSDIEYLNKSYRTTIEIMNEANKINKKLNLNLATPVIRHGDSVEYTNKSIEEIIEQLKEKYNTIAIITNTLEEAKELHKKFKCYDLITPIDISYESRITILPSYLSKGLEFDAVIILNTFKENTLEQKLLYVSMTRALHKLYIKNN
jgi:DNA helicase-2/ATP-dependent DNA helicase PcrA